VDVGDHSFFYVFGTDIEEKRKEGAVPFQPGGKGKSVISPIPGVGKMEKKGGKSRRPVQGK